MLGREGLNSPPSPNSRGPIQLTSSVHRSLPWALGTRSSCPLDQEALAETQGGSVCTPITKEDPAAVSGTLALGHVPRKEEVKRNLVPSDSRAAMEMHSK